MITIIAAVAANGVIGIDNALPWELPSDLAHFKRTTRDHAIIMGRKTFRSLGDKPLAHRLNIVLTSQIGRVSDDARVRFVGDLDEAFTAALLFARECFVIGGAAIYAQAMPYAHRLLISEIGQEFTGDTHFPPIDRAAWEEVQRTPVPGELPYAIVDYRRRAV